MRTQLFLSSFKRSYFQLRRWMLASLFALTLGITLTLAQLPALSQKPDLDRARDWMQQVQQGNQLYQNQQYTEALQVWQKLAENLRGDAVNRSMALSNLSLTYQQLGQWQQAEAVVLASRRSLQTTSISGVDYDRVLAQTLEIQGRLHLIKGQPEQALTLWQQAEQLYTHLNDRLAIARSQINQAQALQNLGNYLLAQKQLTQATQSLQSQPDSPLKATGLRSLANVLRQIGALEKSRQELQFAEQIAQRIGSPQLEAEILLDLGNLAHSQARRFEAISRTEDAEESTRLAHKYFQDVIQRTENLPVLQLRAFLNELALLIEQQQFNPALERFQSVPSLLESVPPGRFAVYARLRYVQQGLDLLQASNQIQQSSALPQLQSLFAHTQKALQQAQQLQDQRAEAQALGQLGKLYASNQQWPEAKRLTERALRLANAPDLTYQLQWQMGRILVQEKDKQSELESAISHYTAAIQSLDTVRHNLMPTNPDVQFSFRDQVEPVYRELVDLLLTNPTPVHLKQSVQYIDALQLAELENFLRCPIGRRISLNPEVDPQSALLHSIVLADRVVTIFEHPGHPLQYHATLIQQKQAEATLQALQTNILKQNRPEAVIRDASQIYQWLIAPFESELEQSNHIKTLVFTLDGALRNIPVAALYDAKREEYLIQKPYATAFTPGLSLFKLKPLKRHQMNILAAGVSEARTVENREFEAIANVEQELHAIYTLFPSKTRQLLNSEFTETTFRKQIDTGAFAIAHLATHGAFSSDPEATYILTSDRLIKSDAWNDLLKTTSQTTLKPIDLLVLSACETAKGDKRATLGLAGIAIRAGAQSTISSLWKVNDQSTAKLMTEFYTELLKPNVTRAEALQRAQQSVFNDPSFTDPFFWATFVVVGNWL
jgi:CHAT domain-containing protein